MNTLRTDQETEVGMESDLEREEKMLEKERETQLIEDG